MKQTVAVVSPSSRARARTHLADALQAARAELAVVLLVARGGACVHDVVAVLAAGHARLVVLGIVLEGGEGRVKATAGRNPLDKDIPEK